MKRDLSKPLAPTFGEKPKKKIKTVTPTKSGGTKTVVTKNKKDRYGKSKVKKTVVRDSDGKLITKFKSKTPKGNIYNSKKRTVTDKGRVIKEDKIYGYDPEGKRKRVKTGAIAKTKSTYVTPSGTKVKKKESLQRIFKPKQPR